MIKENLRESFFDVEVLASDTKSIEKSFQTEKYLTPRTRKEITTDLAAGKYVIKKMNEDVIGFARISSISEGWEEIGSVFVSRDYRLKGLGTVLVEEAIEKASQRFLIGITGDSGLEIIFQRLGFSEIEINKLPLKTITGILKDRFRSRKRLAHLFLASNKNKFFLLERYGEK